MASSSPATRATRLRRSVELYFEAGDEAQALFGTLLVGLVSFSRLGRLEDPNFNVPTMNAVAAFVLIVTNPKKQQPVVGVIFARLATVCCERPCSKRRRAMAGPHGPGMGASIGAGCISLRPI